MQAKAMIEAEAEQSARMLTLTHTPSTFGLHKLPSSLEERSPRSISFALFHQSTCIMSKAIFSANAKSDHYRHHPLSLTRDQFRLIKISPGRLNEGILCHVRHFDRVGKDAYGSYTALSYTWGAVEAVGPIYMQTVGANEDNFPAPFTVTQNLADILRHIVVARETDPGDARWEGWWWIDALCIIQTENDPEKDRQINLMPATYSDAGEVYAWIGRGTERTNSAIDFMDRRFRDSEFAELSSASVDRWHHFPDLPSWIGEVFARPYWRRLWIIQELSMSSKKTTIACGYFETSLQALHDYAEGVVSMAPEELASEPLEIDYEQVREAGAVIELVMTYRIRGAGMYLADLIDRSHDSVCGMDKKDYIRALLGLVGRGRGLHIDASQHRCPCSIIMAAMQAMTQDLHPQDSHDAWLKRRYQGDIREIGAFIATTLNHTETYCDAYQKALSTCRRIALLICDGDSDGER